MKLQLCTWELVERYLERSQTILIPIGSTEQHGPNGYIGTDAICPQAIALGVGESRELLVAPTIHVGMAQHHMRFAGSMTLRPGTLTAVLVDTIESLAVHGFRELYFLNGHGGNIATIKSAFSEYYASSSLGERKASGVRTYLRNWWEGERVRQYSKTHFGAAEGSHATPTEISLTYYLHPPQFEWGRLEPEIANGGTFYDADDYRSRFPDGRIGSDPSLASVDHGERIYQAALADVIGDLDELAI